MLLWVLFLNINAVAGDTVTCRFTIDNYIHNVYVDGIDVADSVTGNYLSWGEEKSVTFDDSALVLAIKGQDGNAVPGCDGGGFAIKCTSTNADSSWNMDSEADRTSWLVSDSSGDYVTPSADAQGKQWYEIGYRVNEDEFGEPLAGPTGFADSIIGNDDMCGSVSNEGYWHFLYAQTPPRQELPKGAFVLPNDPEQRALCRVNTEKQGCLADPACSWNVFQGMCNDFGHQPLFETCDACAFNPSAAPEYATGNNGYWNAQMGITRSDSDSEKVARWEGSTETETEDLTSVDLLAPESYDNVYLAEPGSDRNSHPTYPAVDFRGDGSCLVGVGKHPSGCLDDWTYVVVVKPNDIGWQNIFTTYDAPASRLYSGGGYEYEPWSITPIGIHGWSSAQNWNPASLVQGRLQVVVYSTEHNTGMTIHYYDNVAGAQEFRHDSLTQPCTSDEYDRGYVVMGRGIQNGSHNYNGLIYEAITFPRFMQDDEINTIAEALLAKYAE